jgi:hypothetical protein
MIKRRTPQETAKVLKIRDALSRDPSRDKTKLARDLQCHKCTVFRVADEMSREVPPPVKRCPGCGCRLYTRACLACELRKN